MQTLKTIAEKPIKFIRSIIGLVLRCSAFNYRAVFNLDPYTKIRIRTLKWFHSFFFNHIILDILQITLQITYFFLPFPSLEFFRAGFSILTLQNRRNQTMSNRELPPCASTLMCIVQVTASCESVSLPPLYTCHSF